MAEETFGVVQYNEASLAAWVRTKSSRYALAISHLAVSHLLLKLSWAYTLRKTL